MVRRSRSSFGRLLERLATSVTHWTGGTSAFALAFAIIVVWVISGPLFGFSDTWQLVINTGTTIVTFLMVFLIQRSQNKESLAVQLKLNELVSAVKGASNRLIDVEELGEEELHVLHTHYAKLAGLAESESPIAKSHSVDEAASRHNWKKAARHPHP
jgi:low affinity Fe/Cu permease